MRANRCSPTPRCEPARQHERPRVSPCDTSRRARRRDGRHTLSPHRLDFVSIVVVASCAARPHCAAALALRESRAMIPVSTSIDRQHAFIMDRFDDAALTRRTNRRLGRRRAMDGATMAAREDVGRVAACRRGSSGRERRRRRRRWARLEATAVGRQSVGLTVPALYVGGGSLSFSSSSSSSSSHRAPPVIIFSFFPESTLGARRHPLECESCTGPAMACGGWRVCVMGARGRTHPSLHHMGDASRLTQGEDGGGAGWVRSRPPGASTPCLAAATAHHLTTCTPQARPRKRSRQRRVPRRGARL